MKILYDLVYFNKEQQGGISKMWLEYFKLISKSNIKASFIVDLDARNITNDYLKYNNFFDLETIPDKRYGNLSILNKVKNLSFLETLHSL